MFSRLVPELCPDCQQKRKEDEKKSSAKQSADPLQDRRGALKRAEQCCHFYHHTLYRRNPSGEWIEEDPQLVGVRTCDLVVKAQCGHDVLVHRLCDDWLEGKLCPDWEPKN